MLVFISKLGLISTAAFMLIAMPVSADEASRNKEIQERFSQCDVNRDGKLTRDEAKGCMPRIYDHFSSIDTQNKGYVTVAEIEAMTNR
ncbi:EF-hand domain-containing protein [Polynucleobacter asymbioticus]|uniref:EF-hand domain-containing protein n=1 Tax=Polynucleobacter asymbioticus TaxID=576611 RepID=UPI00203E3538|nr:EF-hand domain-containing protein [Polynucleobacter asymbioticus]QWD86009.1 EF-hand domain-containing protein [Polynucleobacter asymbioticus]